MSSRLRNSSDRHANLSKVDTMYSLKIDNLTFRTRVVDLYVPRDQFTHSSRGYAFVRYVHQSKKNFLIFLFFILFSSFIKKRDAETAIDRMDGADIDGRDIRVQFARYSRDAGSDGRNKIRGRR
jgi:arginine/serine-rich splicing factor 2